MTRKPPSKPGREDAEDEASPTSRALWTGVLTFGLLEIPVSLHSAVSHRDDISFTLLDRRDLAPVGYERVNKLTGKAVAWDDIVKGYEHAPDEYVVLSDDEIRNANVKASQTIEILEFVNGAEIDSVFWETPYYVQPSGKRRSKAYALLRDALGKSGRVGIAQVVIRTRQRLAALRVRDDVVVLNVLRYAYELRPAPPERLPANAAASLAIQPKEVAMAARLIDSMTTTWDPEAHEDKYRTDVLAMVKKKVASGGSKVIEADRETPAAEHEDVLDLMPLLEKSMGRTKVVRVAATTKRASPLHRTVRRKRA